MNNKRISILSIAMLITVVACTSGKPPQAPSYTLEARIIDTSVDGFGHPDFAKVEPGAFDIIVPFDTAECSVAGFICNDELARINIKKADRYNTKVWNKYQGSNEVGGITMASLYGK